MLHKIHHPSPNFEPRFQGVPLDLIVIHYTDMLTAEEALGRLCDPKSKVSAHFLISKNGEIYQLVDPLYRAWHAGVASWQGEPDINSRSIGIELDNPGHTFGLQLFPEKQMNTLLDLLSDLINTYNIPPHRIVGHSDVAPLRKKDPGELFPWDVLAKKGFGLMPSNLSEDLSTLHPMNTLEMQKALSEIGYGCPQTGDWDEETQSACFAFQRHFTPQELTGYPTALTQHTMQELLQMIRSVS